MPSTIRMISATSNPSIFNEYILSSISLNCPLNKKKYIGEPKTTASTSFISSKSFVTSSSKRQ